jgi:hypothetical protein
MGYLCGHCLLQCETAREPVPLSKLHCHWLLDPLLTREATPPPEQVIREPRGCRRARRQNHPIGNNELRSSDTQASLGEEVGHQNEAFNSRAEVIPLQGQVQQADCAVTAEAPQRRNLRPSAVRKRKRNDGKAKSLLLLPAIINFL